MPRLRLQRVLFGIPYFWLRSTKEVPLSARSSKARSMSRSLGSFFAALGFTRGMAVGSEMLYFSLHGGVFKCEVAMRWDSQDAIPFPVVSHFPVGYVSVVNSVVTPKRRLCDKAEEY